MSYALGQALTASQANARMGWTPAKLRAYYNARAQACKGYADEGACLARIARHTPVTISMGLGSSAYWNARAQACKQYADEGACLARIARRVPVTISMGGLGQTTSSGVRPEDVMAVAATTARLIASPDATLRAQGPQIVAALDRHVVNPLVDRAAVASAPYVVRYLLPPLMLLYVISGVGAFFSYQSFQLQRGKLKANRRRRRR